MPYGASFMPLLILFSFSRCDFLIFYKNDKATNNQQICNPVNHQLFESFHYLETNISCHEC